MNDIFDKISEIESASSNILEAAANRKRELSEKQRERISRYDKEAEENEKRSLSQLQDSLLSSRETELSRVRKQREQTLANMTAQFSRNHAALSQEIFDNIIRK